MESAKSETARVQPDTEAQAAQADAERSMIKAVSALTNLPAGMQAEAEADAARQALYDYMKADESNKAAAHSKAMEQLRESISTALETKGLDKWTRQRLEGILDNIDSKGEMGDNSNKRTEQEIGLDKNKLTRSQGKAVNTSKRIINDHLTEADFNATIMDLEGNPILKESGGYWNHLQEMIDSYKGLRRALRTLEGSLMNPNLPFETKKYLQNEKNQIEQYINRIEEMFKPYGGIK